MALSLDAIVGPLLIFVCLSFVLFGIFIAQVYYYYLTFKRDSPWLRAYVWVMSLLEVSHTILCFYFLHWYFVVHFGDAENGVQRFHWSVRATVVLEVLMVFMAQALYCWRVWHVSNRSRIMTAIPASLAFTRFCLGIVGFAIFATFDRWEQLNSRPVIKWLLTADYVVELSADGTISAIFIFYLLKRRSGTMGFTRTHDIIQKLVYYVLNTALANIICSLAVIMTYNIVNQSLAFTGMIEMRSKLYANIMLALLNARSIFTTNQDVELATVGRRVVPRAEVRIYTDTVIGDALNDCEGENSTHSKPEPLEGKGA